MILDDLRVTKREVAEGVGISTERVFNFAWIFGNTEALCQVSAASAVDNKRDGQTISKKDFQRSFLTLCETWNHFTLVMITST